MSKLAINGGTPVRSTPFPKQNTIDHREEEAAVRVLRSDRLTGYQGSYGKNFCGGAEIQALEQEWSKKFGSEHVIPCNSCTSGLQIALGAIGLAPGDEVIVTPYSMTCSATAPLIWNAIPVFADIEYDYYCLDPEDIEQKITSRTKAILVVDLFGQPYDVERINAIAKKYNLYVIEDAAQAIGSKYKDKYAGTLGDIGVYSLNYGKHITAGEGGIIVTDDEKIAMRCRLIMNHAEAVVNDMPKNEQIVFSTDNNMLGFNMRMTELQAAIARVQLEKFDDLLDMRLRNVEHIEKGLNETSFLGVPCLRGNCTHTYYCHAVKFHHLGRHRDQIIEAVKSELTPIDGRIEEGVPIGCGYIKPIYKMPLFQHRRLYGGLHYPFGGYDYSDVSCPNCEDLYENRLFIHRFIAPPTAKEDLDDVVEAFHKVWKYRRELV